MSTPSQVERGKRTFEILPQQIHPCTIRVQRIVRFLIPCHSFYIAGELIRIEEREKLTNAFGIVHPLAARAVDSHAP